MGTDGLLDCVLDVHAWELPSGFKRLGVTNDNGGNVPHIGALVHKGIFICSVTAMSSRRHMMRWYCNDDEDSGACASCSTTPMACGESAPAATGIRTSTPIENAGANTSADVGHAVSHQTRMY